LCPGSIPTTLPASGRPTGSAVPCPRVTVVEVVVELGVVVAGTVVVEAVVVIELDRGTSFAGVVAADPHPAATSPIIRVEAAIKELRLIHR
jgi:hypothetical protein